MTTPEGHHDHHEGESAQGAAERMRGRMKAIRARWAQMPRRRRLAAIAVATFLLVVLLRRGAPLVQVNVSLTFRPVASTAVSFLGAATVGEVEIEDDD
jgi:hypothetical protein